MKTTIFGVLLDVTPDQDTVLRRLRRKYESGYGLPFNAWLEDSKTSAGWNVTVPAKRSCRRVTPKMRCTKRKTSFGPAPKP